MHYTILVIDDDPGDVEILRRHLKKIEGWSVELIETNTAESGKKAIRERKPDLVFVDYLLGIENGLEFYNSVKNVELPGPVIMLTGQGNEQVAVEAMKAGLADYLVKETITPENLCRAISYALERSAMQRKIEEQRRELEELARIDGLTGIYNRRYFLECLNHEIEKSARYDMPFSVMMLDLDKFKKINDKYGHLVGDQVLATTAQAIMKQIRGTDIYGRYGGEEFCILATNTNTSRAKNLADRICKEIGANEYSTEEGEKFRVTCSIGISQPQTHASDTTTILDLADKALYEAKAKGGNQVVVSADVEKSANNVHTI